MTVEVQYGGSDTEWKITHSHNNGLEESVSLDREEVRDLIEDLKGKGF